MLGGTGTEHGWCDGHFNLTQRVRLPRGKKSKTIPYRRRRTWRSTLQRSPPTVKR